MKQHCKNTVTLLYTAVYVLMDLEWTLVWAFMPLSTASDITDSPSLVRTMLATNRVSHWTGDLLCQSLDWGPSLSVTGLDLHCQSLDWGPSFLVTSLLVTMLVAFIVSHYAGDLHC